MKVYAFDRDSTVETSKGPVSIEKIKRLVKEGNEVWAIGNQRLCREAKIPGVAELCKRLAVNQKSEFLDVKHPGRVERRNRLRMLRLLFPKARAYIVVDDVDLTDMEKEGWIYFTPEEYVRGTRKR